jgi:hypothetical protein
MILWERMCMAFTITDRRISNALKARAAAQNPEFKEFWRNVAETLSKAPK